uniref:NADH-ubiquinone oxidoreductase chain 5 n=1 Tax=Erotylinae sp. 4 ACP-2013 TaxID=1434615 RepID=A0A3G3FXG9_9CUCU|nr:NADH dehydrogenase subunit 5 [Erotylinae sp. 4 ACP-2013]
MLKICKIYFYFLMYLSFIMFVMGLKFLIGNDKLIVEYLILSIQSTNIVMTMLLDWMSLMFMSFVLFISSMVIYYSDEYMYGDKYLNRFIMLVIMFVFSMILLIISPNLMSILLGWDGLGLVSYCLVIYYQNIKSYNAGMLTALSNRIGDVALLMSIVWMLNFGSWNYIYYMDYMKNDFFMNLVVIFVILAAMTKSAQIPFSSWLPAAMAAPTPVSSLVHSSTLVTAGVYLLIRFNSVFNLKMLYFLLFISSITMFMSGLGANFEFDLKKIIALSTLSQLGLMMSILALGSYELAFFHLLVHALFKALLFMCAGNMIHSMNNFQDIRYMGGLLNQMPLTCSFFNICNLSLCGLPFLSGFYSKDLIVEFMSMNYLNIYIYMIFYVSIGLTVCYSFRLSYYSMMGKFNFSSLNVLLENNFIMLKSMGSLIVCVIFSGSMLVWLLFPMPLFICLSKMMKFMTLIFIILGIWLGNEIAKFKIFYINKSLMMLNISNFLSSMWYMPLISTLGLNYYPIFLGDLYKKSFDQGWFEYYGSKNLSKFLLKNSKFFQILSFNHIKIYFFFMVIWFVFLLLNI